MELTDLCKDVCIWMCLVKQVSVDHNLYADGSIRFAGLSLLTLDWSLRCKYPDYSRGPTSHNVKYLKG